MPMVSLVRGTGMMSKEMLYSQNTSKKERLNAEALSLNRTLESAALLFWITSQNISDSLK